jgi:acyl-CoA thioester hydrolase
MENKENLPKRFVESLLRVRYAETDCMGIVYHANYLVWMEVGRTDYFRQLGFTYRRLESEYKLFTPLIEINCRYLASAVYDDEVLVRTYIKQFNRRLVRFGYEIYRTNDNSKLCEGESAHLVVDAERKRTIFPEKVVNAFQNHIYNRKDEASDC